MSQTDYLAPADLRIVGTRTTAELETMNTSELPAWALVMLSTGVLYAFNKTKTVPAGTDIQPLSGGPGIWEEYIPGASPTANLLAASAYAPSPYFDLDDFVGNVWSGGEVAGSIVLGVGSPDWAIDVAGPVVGPIAAGAAYTGAKLLVTVTASIWIFDAGGDPKNIQGCVALASEALVGTATAVPESMSSTQVPDTSGAQGEYANLTFQRLIASYDNSVIQVLYRYPGGGANLGINALQISVEPV